MTNLATSTRRENLEQALKAFPDFERGAIPGSVPFRLDRTHALLEDLDRPDGKYRRVHIVGTKGKGSTTAMLVAILEQSGLRVGAYMSPHLLRFTERIQVAGAEVSEASLLDIFASRVQPAIRRLPHHLGQPTYFEVLTVLALEAFAQFGVEVAMIEAGLGGRLDSTNAIMTPEAILLLPISLDHTQILGSTLGEIAWDKVGVFKSGSVVIAARQTPEVADIATTHSEGVGCTLRWVRSEVHVRRQPGGSGDQKLRLVLSGEVIDARLPLAGAHQAENAATAAVAARFLLKPEHNERSLAQVLRTANGNYEGRRPRNPRYSAEIIARGLESVHLRGRFEIVSARPMVIVDVAHNEASARSLAATVAETQARNAIYVVGLSGDKDASAFFRALAPTADSFICVQANHPRACDAEGLAKAARECAAYASTDTHITSRILVAQSIGAALDQAVALSGGAPVVVTGSFYLVAEALKGPLAMGDM